MFLKGIEIRGFKSFADKTELNFKGGITAVVGPNGSGKSNISDAVRWVLGEQSVKSLRGGKMEDVIFAGTQFRKPVGLAQVSLTLDNSDGALSLDYSDVTISRRLYRSGESEYYINNTQCRLRDVQELFMDTGIGKEGYSIIGQGKIDAILSGKPEERRNLLEEAAGIVKFKSRKEEAEKKLDNTEQNLVRINDILGTYEERLEPLRIESEKAKKFLELSEELRAKEVTIILHSMDKIAKALEKQKSDMLQIGLDIETYTNNKSVIRGELDNQKNILEDFERKGNEERTEYYNLKNRHQALISEISLLKERIENYAAFVKKASMEKQELDKTAENLKENKLEMEREVSSFKKDQEEINLSIGEFEKSVEAMSALMEKEAANLTGFREEEIEYLRKISDARNSIGIIRNNFDISQKKIETLNISSDSFLNSIKINTSTKQALENEIERLKILIEEHEENIKTKRKNISRLSSTMNEDEQKLRSMNVDYHKLDANYNMLQNLEKQYEGYNKAAKNLMLHIDNGKIPEAKGSTFILGNIIEVKDKLEVAVEIALGGAISDIITPKEDLAKKLINYLKDNNLGRATFLPLNILHSRSLTLNSQVTNIQGYIGIASELIGYDKTFESAIQYVLGRTIISQDMDSALKIAKLTGYSNKIVTLTGEVVNPGGSLTGGSLYNKGTNIIGRKREIEETDVKIKEIKESISHLVKKIESERLQIKELDGETLNLRDEIHFNQIEITKVEGRINSVIEDSEKLRQNVKISNDEVVLIKDKIESYKNEILGREKEIAELEKKEKENQEAIEAAEVLIRQREVDNSALKEKLLNFKIKKAKTDETVLNRIRELERLSREYEGAVKRSRDYAAEIQASEDNKSSAEEKIIENEKSLEELASQIQSFDKKFEGYEVEKLAVKDKIKKYEEQYEELILLLEKRESDKHKLDLSCTRLETELEALYQRLNEEMGLTYAEADKYKMEMDNPEKFKADITTLKGKISVLGIVNPGAIEEYEQTKEKFTFMNTQKEDLIKAKLELMNVINDMTSKMKELFEDNFKKLRENFNETFRELFKGGSADLILGEGDELTANIDINVQPPGKKLQNINLMSGGEKGLSAIALLFAILKMKPTPFCILDEIEAALDDANVARYAEFLMKFSGGIQFIVITHRKGTMEASDVLYGVTMEEKGVSKIVSVDLGQRDMVKDMVS